MTFLFKARTRKFPYVSDDNCIFEYIFLTSSSSTIWAHKEDDGHLSQSMFFISFYDI